jgi:hypothetical protein
MMWLLRLRSQKRSARRSLNKSLSERNPHLDSGRRSCVHERPIFLVAFASISKPMKHLCGDLVPLYKGAMGFCLLPMTLSMMNDQCSSNLLILRLRVNNLDVLI